MKTKILFLLLLTSLGTYAQDGLSEKETNNINTLINSTIQVNADAIKSNDINKILDASFYNAEVTYLHLGIELVSEMMIIKHNDVFAKFYGVNQLLTLIKSSYKITSKDQASNFEKVLDKLFPPFFESNKEIYQKDNQWFFIRDISFGEKEGIVVTVDDNGKIIEVENIILFIVVFFVSQNLVIFCLVFEWTLFPLVLSIF